MTNHQDNKPDPRIETVAEYRDRKLDELAKALIRLDELNRLSGRSD